jgi:hypothetical protein
MADVFISYTRVDAEFVRGLHADLIQQGLDAWVDWEDIPPSSEWRQEVYRAVQGANAFVAVLSPEFGKSKVCAEELAEALKYGKRIVPIVCRPVRSVEVAPDLAKLNWVYCRAEDDRANAFSCKASPPTLTGFGSIPGS